MVCDLNWSRLNWDKWGQTTFGKYFENVVCPRFFPVSGTRLNDPATGYVAKDGSYVVRNDRTGAIVQVSDKNDKNWVAPWE
ncbi:colicin E5-related ribonuclease [Pseudomonas sp. LF-5]|uniref:colicin E5-related ribonuclease n=1 Tax=Pseudomonas sp. LF-5 TaxID=3031121 RepID=UPI00403FA9EC